jgi:hypothetical protein
VPSPPGTPVESRDGRPRPGGGAERRQ